MKHIFNIILIATLTVQFCFSQKQKCNYIEDYYQDIYKAQLHYLQKEYDEAYQIFESINPNCEILNQPEIYELLIYAEICARKGEGKKAYKLLKIALKTGTTYKVVETNQAFSDFLDKKYLKKLKRKSKRFHHNFSKSIDSSLRKEIITMFRLDQEVRNDLDYDKMKIIDSVHQERMKEILKKYGFPNEKLIGRSNKTEKVLVTPIFMHFNDIEYFKPILLEEIKIGQCTPSVLGSMVDSYDRKYKKYTYGMYRNVDSTEIKDFKNLDKRRISIGLPPIDVRKKIVELLLKKYKLNL